MKPPARWLCEIENSNIIDPNKTYSLTELSKIVSRHRSTISASIDVWTRNLTGNLDKNRRYICNNSNIYRQIRGSFLINLSKKCNDFIHENGIKIGTKNKTKVPRK